MTRERRRLVIDERLYKVEVVRKVAQSPDAPRLVMPAYHPNAEAAALTRVALSSIRKFTASPHELWVVDNNSPSRYSAWLRGEPGVNVVFNRTEPLPPGGPSGMIHALRTALRPRRQLATASYANGVALQIAAELVDPETSVFGVFHNDVLACKAGWLRFMLSKLDDSVRGFAVATHTIRTPAMSASGFLFDFTLFRPHGMNMLPNMPHWDAAELVSLRIQEAGYHWLAAENTFNSPVLLSRIPENSPLRALHSDRSFDDAGDVFFLHMGRGAVKVTGQYDKPGKTYPRRWVAFAENHLGRVA